MSKMKILFVSEYYYPKVFGGGEINLHVMAKSLACRGNDVHVATSFFRGLRREEMIDGVKVHRVLSSASGVETPLDNLRRSIVFPRSVKNTVPKLDRGEDFDVIHFIGSSVKGSKVVRNSTMKPVYATVESYLSVCPKGDLIYMGEEPCDRECNYSLFVRCYRKSKEIGKMKNRFYLKNPIAESYIYEHFRSIRDSLVHAGLIAISGFIKGRLAGMGLRSTVIPNIVEVENFRRASGKKGGASKSGRPRVLYLGSYTSYKGPMVVLDAIDGLNVDADFYGEGNLKRELESRAKKLRKANAAINASVPYDRIPGIYANSDIVVFPSLWPEPFGRISVEAMASGKPVIGSDIGGISETISNEAGILVRPGDVSGFRDAIKRLARSKASRERMGKAGISIAEKKYSPGAVTGQLSAFYRNFRR